MGKYPKIDELTCPSFPRFRGWSLLCLLGNWQFFNLEKSRFLLSNSFFLPVCSLNKATALSPLSSNDPKKVLIKFRFDVLVKKWSNIFFLKIPSFPCFFWWLSKKWTTISSQKTPISLAFIYWHLSKKYLVVL